MSETQEITSPSAQPGQLLKRAREARNLTVAAIATQMNLDLRIVEALEAGDQSRLPAPIFVRGYLRGYARLVDVPESAVLEAYQAQAPQEPVPRAVGRVSAPLRPALRRSTVPWRAVFLTVLLIGLGLAGFQFGPQLLTQFGAVPGTADTSTSPDAVPGAGPALPVPAPASEAQPASPPPETEGAADGALTLPLPAPQAGRDVIADSAPGTEPALPAEDDFGASRDAGSGTPARAPTDAQSDASNATSDAAPEGDSPSDTGAPAPQAPRGPTDGSTGTSDASSTEPAASAPAASASASAPTSDETSATTPAAVPGGTRLAFRFKEQSWVEVRTADGSKLLFGLFGPGETREVSARKPVSVLLGNASGVELRVDGEAFDVVRRSRDNIARFQIKSAD